MKRHSAGPAARLAAVLAVGLAVGAGSAVVEAGPLMPRQADEPVAEPAHADAAVSDVDGGAPSVSGDGRHVVFQGPTVPTVSTVWHVDLETGQRRELTPPVASVRGGNTVHPVISGDGCVVAVVTELALDVFRDDDVADRWDVYRLRLPHCGGAPDDWELVSSRLADGPVARNDVSPDDPPTISRSGAEIAYTHAADQFPDAAVTTVSIVDLTKPIDAAERVEPAVGLPLGPPATRFVHAGIDQPSLSGDGRYLAYRSDAVSDDPVPRWGEGLDAGGAARGQVFVWDRRDADPFSAVRIISATDGVPVERGGSRPAVSRDGRIIAFESADTSLVAATYPACADTCPTQVFVFDRDADRNGRFDEPGSTSLDLVSAVRTTEGVLVAAEAAALGPAVSADGYSVAFVSRATNLDPTATSGGGGPEIGNLFVADLGTESLRTAGSAPESGSVPATSARPALSDTGRTVVYDAARFGVEADPAVVHSGRHVVASSAPPSLVLADVDMGTTAVGRESDEWYVAVINDGPSSFDPFVVSVSDERFELQPDAGSCQAGNLVPPGGDCTVVLTFTPDEPGPISATLEVAEIGFAAVAANATVSGAGGEPALRLDPAGTDFGTVVVGRSGPEFRFDVENVAVLATTIERVTLRGANPQDFVIVADDCSGRPLNPRATCSVGVLFTPTQPGRRTALAEVVNPDGEYTAILLAGDGTYAPEVVVAADTVLAGGTTIVGGGGYPPDTDVLVTVAGGRSGVVARTNVDGAFMVEVPVRPGEAGGDRQIVVRTADGVGTTVAVEVVPDGQPMIGMPGFGLGRAQ